MKTIMVLAVMLFSLCSFSAYSHVEFEVQGKYRVPLLRFDSFFTSVTVFRDKSIFYLHYHTRSGLNTIEISSANYDFIINTDYYFAIFPEKPIGYRVDYIFYY